MKGSPVFKRLTMVEKEHVAALEKWSRTQREALQAAQRDRILGPLLAKLNSPDPTIIFDNIDWLIAALRRFE